MRPLPYVYRKVKNRRINHIGVSLNAEAPEPGALRIIRNLAGLLLRAGRSGAKCGMDSLQFS